MKSLSIVLTCSKKAYRDDARHLQEIRLHEISLVTIGANPMAQITAVKADGNLDWQIRQFRELLAECRKSWQ